MLITCFDLSDCWRVVLILILLSFIFRLLSFILTVNKTNQVPKVFCSYASFKLIYRSIEIVYQLKVCFHALEFPTLLFPLRYLSPHSFVCFFYFPLFKAQPQQFQPTVIYVMIPLGDFIYASEPVSSSIKWIQLYCMSYEDEISQ